MKVQINTEDKIVTLLDEVGMSDLCALLNVLQAEYGSEWKVKSNTTFTPQAVCRSPERPYKSTNTNGL